MVFSKVDIRSSKDDLRFAINGARELFTDENQHGGGLETTSRLNMQVVRIKFGKSLNHLPGFVFQKYG